MKYNLYVITETRDGYYHSKTIFVTQTGFVNFMICHANLLTYKEKDVVITLEVNIIYDIEIEEKSYSLLKIAIGDIND